MYFNPLLFIIVLVRLCLSCRKIRSRNIPVLPVLILTACTANPTSSTTSIRCKDAENATFYIVNHGLHTGIAIKRDDLIAIIPALSDDLAQEEYVEIGWGDERFYQAPNATAGLAIQAMLWPTASVIHAVTIPRSPDGYFSKSEILELSVPRSGYQNMLVHIANTFTLTNEKQITRLGPGLYGKGFFYSANGSFHMFNTCNTWVAAAIATTGYPVPVDGIIRSESLMKHLRQNIKDAPECYSVK